ncbi:hypothetical protein CEY15_15415 [Dietzia natronolimnaea]|uniref:DUF2993 domain-containing protein n=1 Tax=Dietzia natronolimnaea TaxID=161920 RepID=A0A2A2WLI1_9ACTN|nr:LmeA family phospholipid-binding protein [Dietzia natronolimnaea]PAY22069.1 hypothetical protein CEY15_15415 [Dietzia natronolimnaea]
MRARRTVAVVAATLAVALAGAVTVDSVNASRVEADVSTRIRPATPGVPAPSVMLGGGPTARWTGPGTLESASIRVEGVTRPGLGPVAVEALVTDLHLPADRSADMTAVVERVAVQITGDALGPALGMRDVLVGGADDPSLAGGVEHRARVTGTLEGTDTRVSAEVDLVVDDRGAHLVPVTAATGPSGLPDQDPDLALRRTALTLSPELLPLGVAVETLTVRGGTITAGGTGAPGTTPLGGLARPDH